MSVPLAVLYIPAPLNEKGPRMRLTVSQRRRIMMIIIGGAQGVARKKPLMVREPGLSRHTAKCNVALVAGSEYGTTILTIGLGPQCSEARDTQVPSVQALPRLRPISASPAALFPLAITVLSSGRDPLGRCG